MANENRNLLEYVYWRGSLSFDVDPFNELDALVLSQIGYLNLDKIVPLYPTTDEIALKDVWRDFFVKNEKNELHVGLLLPDDIFAIAEAASKAKRYRNITMSNFVNHIQEEKIEQFSAVAFNISKDLVYISFRGTDDSLLGWVEDARMLYDFPVSCHVDAIEYLKDVAPMYVGRKVALGGHSKGGNIAFYAGIYAPKEIQDNIVKVYSFDGQGFDRELIDLEKLNNIASRLVLITPDTSIVGRFFDQVVQPNIVKSIYSGVNQHDTFSWQIRNDHFIRVKNYTKKGNQTHLEISSFLNSMSDAEKKDLVEDLEQYILNLKAKRLMEFSSPLNMMVLFASKHRLKTVNIRRLMKFASILVGNGMIKTSTKM